MTKFELSSKFKPSGDQPQAIDKLVEGVEDGLKSQVLLGVTGSGKTFTMANLIAKVNKPTLVIAHNKTLAAQLCNEFREFFPNNRVEFFVSYYDYYQPEAYIVSSDTYIEKDMAINEEIDKLRNSATASLLEREDTIVVASVSCIYGLGNPEEYWKLQVSLREGQEISRKEVINKLIEIQYARNEVDFHRATFRAKGDILDIFPANSSERAIRIEFFGDEIERISEFDALTGHKINELKHISIFPATHYAVGSESLNEALAEIQIDMEKEVKEFENQGKLIEAQRLKERVSYDIELMREVGYCNGIENYSRYLTGRAPGEPPPTLFEYLPRDAVLFIDESHVTVPQIGAMSRGDRARKENLSHYGFRLPACIDNRPLTFEEWDKLRPQTIFVSATPAQWELEQSGGVVSEQVIRPTGLLDPVCEVRPTEHQVDDLLETLKKTKGRALVTTLTKKMAEQLNDYLNENGVRARYLHSDIETLERIELLRDLRLGKYDVLVGINLLREGLDVPECELVAIMDADKEGFLRSTRSLIQTIGRAARNANGRVILYADNITESMREALDETARRREIQMKYNAEHGIVPKTVSKAVFAEVADKDEKVDKKRKFVYNADGAWDAASLKKDIANLTRRMKKCAENLEFEEAAAIRDTINKMQDDLLLLE